MRQLEEDVNSGIEVERNENEISVSGEANIVEVMDGIILESSINIITQRDEESSDKSEHDYCINENSDEEASILTMYKSRNGTVWSKCSSNSLQGRRSVENIFRVQGGTTRFILNSVGTSTDIFKELLRKNSLLNIQKYTVAEAKRQGKNNLELSIDELRA